MFLTTSNRRGSRRSCFSRSSRTRSNMASSKSRKAVIVRIEARHLDDHRMVARNQQSAEERRHRRRLPAATHEGTGLGLANVCQRLDARFGSRASCRFGANDRRRVQGFTDDAGRDQWLRTSRSGSSSPTTSRLAAERLQLLLARSEGAQLVGTASDGEVRDQSDRSAASRRSPARHRDARPRRHRCRSSPCRQDPSPAVVFVTAFDQFAVAAFEVEAVDYLMKPVDPLRLQRALDRARAYLAQRTGQPADRQDLAMARGILGVGPVRPGPDRRPRRRPGVGRARLHAAPCRPAQLAHPSFDGGARGGAGSGAVRPASPLGDRSQGLHHRIHPQPVGTLDRPACRRNRTAGRTTLFGSRPSNRRPLRWLNRHARKRRAAVRT